MRVYSGVSLALAVFFCFSASASAETKPNIIFIMVDDMGRDWVSSYGASHPTPNVDRLAAQGIRFENCWCAPICTPTRMELLTGQYPFRTGGVRHHDVPRWGGKGFDWEKFTSFARCFYVQTHESRAGFQLHHISVPSPRDKQVQLWAHPG